MDEGGTARLEAPMPASDSEGHALVPVQDATSHDFSSHALVRKERCIRMAREDRCSLCSWQEVNERRPEWALRGPEHTLCKGSITLPPGGQLWLTEPSVRLDNLTITGSTDATVVVCGCECTATFACCQLRNCSIVVCGGAKLVLDDCTMVGEADAPAVFASGATTSAALSSCRFKGWEQGVIGEGGASVTLSKGCAFEGIRWDALEFRGDGTRAEVTDCTVAAAGRASDEGAGFFASAVHVHSRAAAWVSDTDVTRSTCGFCAEGAASLEMVCCKALHNDMWGLRVCGGAVAEVMGCVLGDNRSSNASFRSRAFGALTSCTVTASRAFSGLDVSGEGTHVEASECLVTGNDQYGVFVWERAAVELGRCELVGNRRSNAAFEGGARGALKGCMMTSSDLSSGLEVTDAGTCVEASDCHLSHNRQAGAFVLNAAAATLCGCEMQRNGIANVLFHAKARGLVTGCAATGSRGPGVAAVHIDTCLTLEGCDLSCDVNDEASCTWDGEA